MLTTEPFKTPAYLMWFDDHPKHSLAQKVAEAAQRYLERFGRSPNTALVHPLDLPESVLDIPQAVRVTATVGRHTLWVGVES